MADTNNNNQVASEKVDFPINGLSAAVALHSFKILCRDCGKDFGLHALSWVVLCSECIIPVEEKFNKIANHLRKKDSLNAKLDFLTRFQLWNDEKEDFQICEELRFELVREKVPKK